MAAAPRRVIAQLNSRALTTNYEIIRDQARGLDLLPMIKANAYGHDAVWAARQLIGMPGLYGLGVATFEEARELREELGARARRVRIVVFSGTAPWTQEKGQLCEKLNLSPVIATDEDW